VCVTAVIWVTLKIILATIFYILSSISEFPYFYGMSLLIAINGLVAVQVSAGNLLFLFRHFLIWLLIFGTSSVWALYGGEVLVAPFGLEYQNLSTTRTLVYGGFLALCGSLTGWSVSMLQQRNERHGHFILSTRHQNKLRSAGLAIAFGFSFLYFYKAGGVVGGDASYGANVRDIGFDFGVFNIFHYLGISFLLISAIEKYQIRASYLWLAVASLSIGVLTGSRADYLPQLFILILLLFNHPVAEILSRRKRVVLLGWVILAVFLLFLGYLVAFFLAFWRTGLPVDVVISRIFNSEDGGLIINEIFGHRMLYMETGNMILGSLYAAIVNAGERGLLWGGSYLNYLLTAPPAFLGLPRPLGLDESVEINGVLMAQGGIFEVAEAYWNFGLVGCFLIPFLISYFFGWLLRKGLHSSNYFFLTWYLVFGFMSFRAVWYQNFSYFRIMTVMLLLYLVSYFLFRWLVGNRCSGSTTAKTMDVNVLRNGALNGYFGY